MSNSLSSFVRALLVAVLPLAVGVGAVGCSSAAADDNPEDEDVGTQALAHSRTAIGSGSVFAKLPADPGFPEGIALSRGKVFVSGPATFGTAGTGPSKTLILQRSTGKPKGEIVTQGEYLPAEHFMGCIAADGEGRLYVLSAQLGVVRFTPKADGSYAQDIYASIPHVPLCNANGGAAPCSPSAFDEGFALANDLAFDDDGNLYVTDSLQAIIWKVAPGGGTASIWASSPRFDAVPFNIGANGIRLSPDHTQVYVSVTNELATGGATGSIFRIPLVDHPKESDIKKFHTYAAGEQPDGLAFAKSGRLYVALVTANAISVLNTDGTEASRLTGPLGSAIPYDGPANIAFTGRSILVVNHAPVTRNADNFAILETFVGETGAKLARPVID